MNPRWAHRVDQCSTLAMIKDLVMWSILYQQGGWHIDMDWVLIDHPPSGRKDLITLVKRGSVYDADCVHATPSFPGWEWIDRYILTADLSKRQALGRAMLERMAGEHPEWIQAIPAWQFVQFGFRDEQKHTPNHLVHPLIVAVQERYYGRSMGMRPPEPIPDDFDVSAEQRRTRQGGCCGEPSES